MQVAIAVIGAIAALLTAIATLLGALNKEDPKSSQQTPTNPSNSELAPHIVQNGNSGVTIAGSNNSVTVTGAPPSQAPKLSSFK